MIWVTLLIGGIGLHFPVYAYIFSPAIRLQIVSEVYKKRPYIRIPTAWIAPTLRLQLLKLLQENLTPTWQAEEIPLRSDAEWANHVKCHPAAVIQLTTAGSPTRVVGILLLYPQNYRGIIEDLLVETPLPIIYLGSRQRVAFYYFPRNNIERELVQTIIQRINLQR